MYSETWVSEVAACAHTHTHSHKYGIMKWFMTQSQPLTILTHLSTTRTTVWFKDLRLSHLASSNVH